MKVCKSKKIRKRSANESLFMNCTLVRIGGCGMHRNSAVTDKYGLEVRSNVKSS